MKSVPRSLALLWILAPFVVYTATVQGHVAYWDTGEMQTVPWIFGIPHPTGFPAFVLAAGIFAHAFPIGAVSWRVAFFCSMLTVGSVCAVYAALVRVTQDRLTAVCASLLLAFGAYFWIDGVRAEVHAMGAFCAAWALYWALRGYYDGSARAFNLSAVALGLGLAAHPIVLFLLPSVLLLAAARRATFTMKSSILALLFLFAPLLLYAYLPLRSHAVAARGLDPAVSLGKPAGAAIWNTDNPQTLRGFLRLAGGTDFEAPISVLRIADFPAYAGNFATFATVMYREFSPVGALAWVLAFALLVRRRPPVAFSLLLAMLLPAAFALSYPPVVEIERYFFIPMIAFAITIGLGIATLPEHYRNMLRLPVAAAAAVLLVANYANARLHASAGAEGLIAAVRSATPSNAIVIADWTRGTPLAYASYVDHAFARRTIDIAWPYQDVRYLPRWLARRPVYYVGRPLTRSGRLLLCGVSRDYPVYAVHLLPGHC